MAKHRRKWNEIAFRSYIREGRGQGAGADYTPWILIQDFASKGMVSRVQGETTGRIHHLMSNLETSFFFIMDWSDDVLDICEQFPLLDLHTAVEIADKAQIKYPYDPQSGFPYVMTSDFYIQTIGEPMVISIKTSSDLDDFRVREKLELERRYWNYHGIKWRVATEKEINMVKAKNIEWLSQAKNLHVFGLPQDIQTQCCSYFESHYASKSIPVGNLLKDTEEEFCLNAGMGLNIYKHLAYRKRIKIDIDVAINAADFIGSSSICLRGE